jgi:hypothetical protein
MALLLLLKTKLGNSLLSIFTLVALHLQFAPKACTGGVLVTFQMKIENHEVRADYNFQLATAGYF